MASLALAARPANAAQPVAVPAAPTAAAALAPLEWTVVALARQDPLSSRRRPRPIAAALAALLGRRRPNRLADDRLEALRRLSVSAWHQGAAVPVRDIRAFFKAGFTPDQLELVVATINHKRSTRNQRTSR